MKVGVLDSRFLQTNLKAYPASYTFSSYVRCG